MSLIGRYSTVKPEFLASTNFRQNSVKERSRRLFFANVALVQNAKQQ